jgi:hypothetical protein
VNQSLELKEEELVDIKIKLQLVTSSEISTERSWSEFESVDSAKEFIEEAVARQIDSLERYAERDKEQWEPFLKKRVIDKGWGRKRTMDAITKSFSLTQEDRKWFEKKIAIYRRMRLNDLSEEEAQRKVESESSEHGQKKLGDPV